MHNDGFRLEFGMRVCVTLLTGIRRPVRRKPFTLCIEEEPLPLQKGLEGIQGMSNDQVGVHGE